MKRLASTFLAIVLAGASAFCSAATLTGTVTNGTTKTPAKGDDVVLLKLAEGMQEVARGVTDAKGHFSLEAPDDKAMHLVRVNHQNVNYHHPAQPGTTTADVTVYDSAAKVEGVAASVDILRVQADSNNLSVIEMYAIKNESSPPRTQMSEHSFEIYLPEGAQLDTSLAAGPGGMPVTSAPVPGDEKNRYAFVFPLRPGETKFQIAYHLPYSGAAEFHPRVLMPVQNLVVMLPKSMQFKSASSSFQASPEEGGLAVYVASSVGPAQKVDFSVSGTGSIPRESQEPGAANAQNQAEAAGAGAPVRPGGGMGVPEDKPDPLHNYRWYILAGAVAVLAAGAWYTMGRNAGNGAGQRVADHQQLAENMAPQPEFRYATGTALPGIHAGPSIILSALKEELFQLETDHLQKRISDEEYAKLKDALQLTLSRALSRG